MEQESRMTEFVEKVLEHIEGNSTKCPYCGMPIVTKIMGYPIRDLLVLLESLRLNGIRPDELTRHTLDLKFAYESVMKALEEQTKKMFGGRAE